jgi:PST family polysaccharide transporter
MVTFVSQGASVLIGLVSTVILARLLSPNDYGVMAMVVAVTAFAGLFRDLGLSSAAIQKHTLTNAQQSNLFWMNIALGMILTVGLAAASPLVVRFYHKPEVLWVTIALSANFLIGSIGSQSGALLVREMRFGRQAVAGICGALVALAVSVALALHDFRYWALVWGQLAGGLITTYLLFVLSPFRPGLPSRGTGVREMLKFGAHITAFNFVNYFQRNLDAILIGRYWGAGPLGLYSRAYSLLMFPINNLRGPINAVAFPAMSRLQNQPEAFRAYFLRVTSLLALVSMPLTAFLFVASKPVIELVLGSKWLGVAPIFSWLAVAAFIQPTTGFVGSFLLSLGQGRRYLQCGLINAVILSASFIVGLPWGAIGVATAYAIGNYVALYPWLRWAFHNSPVSFRDFADACAMPAAVSLTAAGLGFVAKSQITAVPPILQIGTSLLIFLVVLAAAARFTNAGRKHMSFLAGVVGRSKASHNHQL